MYILKQSFLFLILLFVAPLVLAQDVRSPIPGQDEPDFEAALELWLEGNDLPALQALSELSNSGNTAAQTLLGRISLNGPLHAHATASMNRQERIALLRMPGGLSGKSWLSAASENSVAASALLQSNQINERLGAIPLLFETSESVAAIRAARIATHNGKFAEIMQILNQTENLPDEALPLWLELHQAANHVPSHSNPFGFPYAGPPPSDELINRGQQIQESVKIQERFPYTREFLVGDQKAFEEIRSIASSIPHWTPYAQFCTRECPDDIDGCTAVAGALSAFGNAPFPMSSPSQKLLSNERYWQSARIDIDIARRMYDVRETPELMTELNSCFVPTIARMQTEMDLPQ